MQACIRPHVFEDHHPHPHDSINAQFLLHIKGVSFGKAISSSLIHLPDHFLLYPSSSFTHLYLWHLCVSFPPFRWEIPTKRAGLLTYLSHTEI